FQRCDQILDGLRADEVLPLGASREQRLGLVRRPVVDRDGEAVPLDVERQVLAHDGEADQSDLRFSHGYLLILALPPLTTCSTSSRVTIEVSPRVDCASAPWAAPYSTASCGPLPDSRP